MEREMTKEQFENTTKLLKSLAKSDCIRCYGRGYSGREVKRNVLIPCKCIDKEELKNKILQKGKLVKRYG